MGGEMSKGPKQSPWPTWPLEHVLFFAMVIAAIAIVAYLWQFWSFSFSPSLEHWAQTGDYFGGLMNPAISFATLVVAYAVWRQQKDELRETKDALKEQAETSKQQRREQRFFDLLNVYFKTIESLRFDSTTVQYPSGERLPVTFYGRDAIQNWLACGSSMWAFTEARGIYASNGTDSEDFRKLVSTFRNDWQDSLGMVFFGSYLRTIESLLSTARLLFSDEQRSYIDLFKAQLSKSELVLIAYFLLLEESESRRFRQQVEQYGLLSNLMDGDLRSLLKDALPAGAFSSESHELLSNL
jgi:hypothetical protein